MKNRILAPFIFCVLTLVFSCNPVKEITIGGKVNQIKNGKVMVDSGKPLTIANANKEGTTVIYMVRHAEKELTKGDVSLTEIGKDRAKRLANILSEAKIDAVYSSDYNRTKQTAAPTANSKNLTTKIYNPRDMKKIGDQLVDENKGNHILVVGHSNTTPTLLNHLMGETVVESIDESDYTNLYVVSISKSGEIRSLLLKF